MEKLYGDMNYTRLTPLLTIGSKPPKLDPGLALRWDTLVLCAREEQSPDPFYPGLHVMRLRVDDGPITDEEKRAAVRIGTAVAEELRRGRRVLVTCAMGRNRSALVCGIALIRLGMWPSDAIRFIRTKRKPSLWNEDFVDLLMEPERRARAQGLAPKRPAA